MEHGWTITVAGIHTMQWCLRQKRCLLTQWGGCNGGVDVT